MNHSVRRYGNDPLSDVLQSVRLEGGVFFLWEPSAPYASHVPEGEAFGADIVPGSERVLSYHIVAEGPCWAAVSGREPVRLETGDVLVLPHGDPYVISSDPVAVSPEHRAEAIEFFRQMAAGDLPPVVREGGGGRLNRVICGFLGCDVRPFNPVIGALPRMITIGARDLPSSDPLPRLVDFALDESRTAKGGGRCVLSRLSELLFVEVIRRYLASAPLEEGGWLAGLRDPVVGQALTLLHRRPSFAWTLELLAKETGASKSTLSDRFARTVGHPPMQYLARWRMQIAARRLADGAPKILRGGAGGRLRLRGRLQSRLQAHRRRGTGRVARAPRSPRTLSHRTRKPGHGRSAAAGPGFAP